MRMSVDASCVGFMCIQGNCVSVVTLRIPMKLLSLCTGYGGLDLAVEAYFGAELIGCSDIDKASSVAIDTHFKVPNYGDLKNLIGTDLKFDILTAGYPCQPFSIAGNRKGTNDKRHIWPFIAQIIGHSRPRIVILENVRGHLSLGFKEVVQTLAELGYAVKWSLVRASDVGAPHQRARLFILATTDTNSFGFSLVEQQSRTQGNQGQSQSEPQHLGQSTSGHTKHFDWSQYRQMPKLERRFASRLDMSMQKAPDPLVNEKLNTRFVEYMMGLPEGWVTDLPISRSQQFKLLGNGVVPQQAYYALQLLCDTPEIGENLA